MSEDGFSKLPKDVLRMIIWLLSSSGDVLRLRLALPRRLGVDDWIFSHPFLGSNVKLCDAELTRGLERMAGAGRKWRRREKIVRSDVWSAERRQALAYAGLKRGVQQALKKKSVKWVEVEGLPATSSGGSFSAQNIFESLDLPFDDSHLLAVGYDCVFGKWRENSWQRISLDTSLGCRYGTASVVASSNVFIGTDINTFEIMSLKDEVLSSNKTVFKSEKLRHNVRRMHRVGLSSFVSLGVYGIEQWDLETLTSLHCTVNTFGSNDKFYDLVPVDGNVFALSGGKQLCTLDIRSSKRSLSVLNDGSIHKNYHGYAVYALSCDANRQTLVSGGGDSRVCCWDLRYPGRWLSTLNLPGGKEDMPKPFVLKVDLDGCDLTAVGSDGFLHMFRVDGANFSGGASSFLGETDITSMVIRADSILCAAAGRVLSIQAP